MVINLFFCSIYIFSSQETQHYSYLWKSEIDIFKESLVKHFLGQSVKY